MGTAGKNQRAFVFFFILVLLLTSLGGSALAQKSMSGKEGAPVAVEPVPRNPGPQEPLPDCGQVGRALLGQSFGFGSDLDRSSVSRHSETKRPVSEMLAGLTEAEKRNALIELELAPSSAPASRSEAVRIAALWNGGDFDQALARLRQLETTEGAARLAVGIAWRTPRPTSTARWGTDAQIGSAQNIRDSHLDYDAGTGNLFALLLFTGVNDYWTVNLSTDGGQTWFETFTWATGYQVVNDVCGRVVADYFWVGYTGIGATVNSEARLRRFAVADGLVDGTYDVQVVFDNDQELLEISVETNADSSDNRVYYCAVQVDETVPFFWANEEGLTWNSFTTGITDAVGGLDLHWNYDAAAYFLVLCYRNNLDQLHVVRIDGATAGNIYVDDDVTGDMAIAAYDDRIMTVFEAEDGSDHVIKYWISYDGGDNWYWGYVASSEPEANYFSAS